MSETKVLFTPLPRGLVIPDGTGIYLPGAPTLTLGGPPLVVSNSPEQVTDRHGNADLAPIVLHRTQVPDGRFRLFYHHQLLTRDNRFFGFALVNHGTRPLEAYLARSSGSVRSMDPAQAGQIALRSYFGRSPFARVEDHYAGTIAPGDALFLTDLLEPGQTTTGIFDVALRDPSGARPATTRPPVTLVMLADRFAGFGPTDRRRALMEALLTGPIATPDPSRSQRTRGTFAHADRTGIVACDIGPGENGVAPRFLDLAGPYSGRYARALSGEFERPLSPRTEGTLPDGNPGNYGVLYDLRVVLTNRLTVPIGVTCLLNAAGGPGGSVLGVGSESRSPRTMLNACDSWIWEDVSLRPGGTCSTALRFSLPGGANGAHRLFFWPRAIPG